MIRPHELDQHVIYNQKSQLEYERHIDNKLRTNDFSVAPRLFISDPIGITLADRAVVLAKYGTPYEIDGESLPGWKIEVAKSGVFFMKPYRADIGTMTLDEAK